MAGLARRRCTSALRGNQRATRDAAGRHIGDKTSPRVAQFSKPDVCRSLDDAVADWFTQLAWVGNQHEMRPVRSRHGPAFDHPCSRRELEFGEVIRGELQIAIAQMARLAGDRKSVV